MISFMGLAGTAHMVNEQKVIDLVQFNSIIMRSIKSYVGNVIAKSSHIVTIC